MLKRTIYFALLLLTAAGIGIAAARGGQVAPYDPLNYEPSGLLAEPMDGGSSSDMQTAAEQTAEETPEKEQEEPENHQPERKQEKEEEEKQKEKTNPEEKDNNDRQDGPEKDGNNEEKEQEGEKEKGKEDGQDDKNKKNDGSGDERDDGKKGEKKPQDEEKKDPEEDPDKKPSGEEAQVRIVTDLVTGIRTQEELPDGVLSFYAYGAGADNLSVRVTVRNVNERKNTSLRSENGSNYRFKMELGETYQFTIYLDQPGHVSRYITRYVTWQASRADEDNPEVGEYPPFITTNLDHYTDGDIIEGENLAMIVTVRSNPDYRVVTADRIAVTLNGVPVEKHGGDSSPEYDLHFEPPNVGDYKDYKIAIVAWYGNNSRYWSRTLRYHALSEEDSAGTVSIVLDATSVGLGILDEAEYEIKKGDTAADILLRFLEDYGYEIRYDSGGSSFYIRRISRGDMCYGASVPDDLWKAVIRDGINLNEGQHDRDSLGEHDYTMGSGWMYAVDGTYPGRSMNRYEVKNGSRICVRFTLSYGKDIGGFDATGGGAGRYAGYCGIWTEGHYQALGHQYEESARVPATGAEDGYIEYICRKCGDTYREVIPATGEDPSVTPTPEPTDTPTPTPGPTDIPTPTPDPTDTPTPTPEPTDTPTPTPDPTDTPTPTPDPTDTPTPTPEPTEMPDPDHDEEEP